MNSDIAKPLDWCPEQYTNVQCCEGKSDVTNSCAWSPSAESGDAFHGDVFSSVAEFSDCRATPAASVLWRHQSLAVNNSLPTEVECYTNYATARPHLVYNGEGNLSSCQDSSLLVPCYSKSGVSSDCELVCSPPAHMSQGFYDWLNSYCPETCVRKRNQRERERVRCVNEGYARLLRHLPNENKQKRLSKVETLRKAIQYIKQLQQVLQAADSGRPTSNVGSPS